MSAKETREYFEEGCLCILTGIVVKQNKSTSNKKAVEYYMQNCKCSHHPEGTARKKYDKFLENAMRDILKYHSADSETKKVHTVAFKVGGQAFVVEEEYARKIADDIYECLNLLEDQ